MRPLAGRSATHEADRGEHAVAELGRYQKVGLLGQGGMGQVFLGFDPVLERYVAVKQISRHVLMHPDNATLLAYFEREAKVVASLQHPNIIQIYEYGHGDGAPAWLATEFVDGLTFEELTETLDGMDPVDVLIMIHPIA
ncbi:MAG: serine/threonine protein kinase, partial [Myxococcota bacterium]